MIAPKQKDRVAEIADKINNLARWALHALQNNDGSRLKEVAAGLARIIAEINDITDEDGPTFAGVKWEYTKQTWRPRSWRSTDAHQSNRQAHASDPRKQAAIRLSAFSGITFQSDVSVPLVDIVRAAMRRTHPDAPGGSADAYKEVTQLGQLVGVLDERGQIINANDTTLRAS